MELGAHGAPAVKKTSPQERRRDKGGYGSERVKATSDEIVMKQ